MKAKKISLQELQGALSRTEMKKIMAGSAWCGTGCGAGAVLCGVSGQCLYCRDAWGRVLPPGTGIGVCSN